MPRRGHDPTPALVPADPPARVVSRRYHFHWPGLAYAACAVVLVFGAINGQNNLLFWLFGLAVAGLILSGLVSGAVLMRLELTREAPRTATVGEPVTIHYTLRNRARFIPALALHVEELPLPNERPLARPPGRLTSVAPFIPPRGALTVRASIRPLHRGRTTLSRIRVWTTFPFGLMKKSVTFEQHAHLLVRPAPAVIDPAVWASARGPGGGSTSIRARHGDEFHSLREYAPGDSIRRIAWRATARLDRPVIRELSDHASSDAVIVLEPGDPGAWELAVSAAAGLALDAARRGFALGLAAPDGWEPPARGRRHLERTLDALAVTQPSRTPVRSPDVPAQRLRIRAEPQGVVIESGARRFPVAPVPEPAP
jgi:uncharacterized protein (DUF58 family)